MTFHVTSFHWTGEGVIKGLSSRIIAAHRAAAEMILEKANEHVPYDTGELQGSGFVDADEVSGTVGYSAPYASIVHESTDMAFQGKGQSKWLEQTLSEEGKLALDTMAEKVAEEF